VSWEPQRDRYGRYLLPDPVTGRRRAYTRTTTLAKCLADTSALERWKQRMVATGLRRKPELLQQVEVYADDRRALDDVCEQALQAAGAGDAAQAGTDLHSITEQVDLGTLALGDVPVDARPDVRAYVFALEKAGIEVIPDYVERLVVNTVVDVAGTFDRILRLKDGRLVIADLKTGKDLGYSWGDIAIQLSVYRNAAGMYDPETDGYVDLPDLDPNIGIVMHLPIGQGRCTLYEVDIDSGWQAAQIAQTVRTWRGRKDLSAPVLEYDGETVLLDAIDRADSVQALTELWSGSTDRWTDRHTAAASARKTALLASAAA
jgi:hypothetical protein